MRIVVASDHAAWQAKDRVVAQLLELGHQVEDLGTNSDESTDYPRYAYRVADAIAAGRADRGVLLCGTGIGMSITANRVPGVRAALVHDAHTAQMSRAHNDANVLCLGARILDQETIERLVGIFLDEPFDGGRHERRVAMFDRRPDSA